MNEYDKPAVMYTILNVLQAEIVAIEASLGTSFNFLRD